LAEHLFRFSCSPIEIRADPMDGDFRAILKLLHVGLKYSNNLSNQFQIELGASW
jgi:hypothetical protein